MTDLQIHLHSQLQLICTGADVSVYNPLSETPFLGEFSFNETDADTMATVYVRLNPGNNIDVTLERNVDILISTSVGTAGKLKDFFMHV